MHLPNVRYKGGQPDFCKWTWKKGRGANAIEGVVAIQYNDELSLGDDKMRQKDFDAADEAMRKKLKDPDWKRPDGHTWHHESVMTNGKGTMRLVRSDIHAAATHRGAFSWFKSVLTAKKMTNAGQRAKAVKNVIEGKNVRRVVGGVAGKATLVFGIVCAAPAIAQAAADDGWRGAGIEVAKQLSPIPKEELEIIAVAVAEEAGDTLMLSPAGNQSRLEGRFRAAGINSTDQGQREIRGHIPFSYGREQ